MFRGWPVEALEFFEGLEADNSKTYWQAHKDVYEQAVRAPMEALVAELEPDGDASIFRPYRDIRFSADKSPYKTHIGAVIHGTDYVQVNARGLAAGCGMWEMAPDQLQRYREAVDDDASGEALRAIVQELLRTGIEPMAHGELKTAPRGYPKDHPRVELLRYKGLAAWREWPAGAWLGTRRAKERLTTFFDASRPLLTWLQTHVGPSTLPRH